MCRRTAFLTTAVVFLCSFGDLKAEAGAEARARAASALFRQFDTIAYASTEVLSRFERPKSIEPNSASDTSLPISLRLPFVEMIGALQKYGHNTVNDLRQNYDGVLVGAKSFTPPEGIGMVSSQECYIGILRADGRSLVESAFGQAKFESVDGNHVWTWSAPPYEGYPHDTTFYLTEIEHRYLVLGNDLDQFRETVQTLNRGDGKGEIKTNEWEPPTIDKYWIYRSLPPNKPGQEANAVVLKYVLDEAMNSRVEVYVSDKTTKSKAGGLPASEVLHYVRKEAGTWQAPLPLSKDPATTTALYQVFSLFGFGVVL